MSKDAKQYTIRQIPEQLDRRLRKLARQRGISLNALVVECLAREADIAPEQPRYHDSERTSILLADEDTTHHYATIYSQLRRLRRPIPVNDLWIAALCLQNDLPLFTRDRHFLQIPQLQCL